MRSARVAMGVTALLAMIGCGDANTVTGIDKRNAPVTAMTAPPVTITRVTPPPRPTRTPSDGPCPQGAHDCPR
jgi:hypothetical protein